VIFTSNLDGFCTRRVGMLRNEPGAASEGEPGAPARDSRERLTTIRTQVQQVPGTQASCYRDLHVRLVRHRIVRAPWQALDDAEREDAPTSFDGHAPRALTPLVLDPPHPLPFISNPSTNRGPRSGDFR
jgi:polyphosphate kinase